MAKFSIEAGAFVRGDIRRILDHAVFQAGSDKLSYRESKYILYSDFFIEGDPEVLEALAAAIDKLLED